MNCRYCHQPIYETEQTAGAYGRMVYMRGKYLHIEGDAWGCEPQRIDPAVPRPLCHICKVETPPPHGICSAQGMPRYSAKPDAAPDTKADPE